MLRRVNFGIEQGGRQKFMLRWRFQVEIHKGDLQWSESRWHLCAFVLADLREIVPSAFMLV